MSHRITSCDDPDYMQHFGILPDIQPEGATCYGCGEGIAPEHVEASTQVPPDYLPEGFRKRATVVLCELCRTEGDEA